MDINNVELLITNSNWGISLGLDRPEKRNVIITAANLMGQLLWHLHPWKFRRQVKTFATIGSKSTYDLADDVSEIYDMTYSDGGTIRQIKARDGDFVADTYDGSDRTGTQIKWFEYYKGSSAKMTIELTPIPDAVYTVTYKYLNKFVSIANLPERFLGATLIAIRGYLTEGSIDGYPPFENAVMRLMHTEKPTAVKKWKMELDAHTRNNKMTTNQEWK